VTVQLPDLTLECGATVRRPRLAGGDLGPGRSGPVTLVVHALTGDARADQWWSGVVGRGAPVDPTVQRVLCFNNLGSCYGSSGPTDPDFPTTEDVPGPPSPVDAKGAFPRPRGFPAPITPWDQARALLGALDRLGVHHVERLVGGSLGGMVALCLAVLAPERFGRVVALATAARSTPWMQAYNHVGRQAIALDPEGGLELARQLAHLSYRAPGELGSRFGRDTLHDGPWRTHPYATQTYLTHQGRKLARRFDPMAYVAGLDAMDHHDLERRPVRNGWETWSDGGPWGIERLRGERLDLVAIDTDQLFPPSDLAWLHARVPGSRFVVLPSVHGHDGFLLESHGVARLLTRPRVRPSVAQEELSCRS